MAREEETKPALGLTSSGSRGIGLDSIARELLASLGAQEAKGVITRLGFSEGLNFQPAVVRLTRLETLREVFAQFLHEQNMTDLRQELHPEPGLILSIKFRPQDHSCLRLLKPWYFAGWCSGFASQVLGREYLFRVVRMPDNHEPYCVLTGKEETAWEMAEAEPVVDYQKFHRRGQQTRSLAMRVCLDRMKDMALGENPLFLQVEACEQPVQLARYVHVHSQRAQKNFVYCEGRSMSAALLENAILSAAHGTLFIRSPELIPARLQQRLLQVVGNSQATLNVRLLVACERSLSGLHRAGRLIPGLVRHLQGWEILVPSLRMRMEDLLPLSKRILGRLAPQDGENQIHFSAAILNEFLHHEWTGGISELRRVVETLLENRSEEEIQLDTKHLPKNFSAGPGPSTNLSLVGMSVAEAERRLILATLQQARGNKLEAAKALKIGYNTLWRKLKSYAQESRPKRRVRRARKSNLSPPSN